MLTIFIRQRKSSNQFPVVRSLFAINRTRELEISYIRRYRCGVF